MDRVELPRPLTLEESRAIRALLEHQGFPGRDALLGQVSTARVIGRCDCGCATVELAVDKAAADDAVPQPISAEGTVLDENGDEIGGLLLFVKDGRLNQLEIYSYGEEPIRSLPSSGRLIIR